MDEQAPTDKTFSSSIEKLSALYSRWTGCLSTLLEVLVLIQHSLYLLSPTRYRTGRLTGKDVSWHYWTPYCSESFQNFRRKWMKTFCHRCVRLTVQNYSKLIFDSLFLLFTSNKIQNFHSMTCNRIFGFFLYVKFCYQRGEMRLVYFET